MCTYRYNLFAHSSCTSLFILIFIKSIVDCIAHFMSFHILLLILFYFIYFLLIFILFLPIFIILSCVMFHLYFIFLHCPLSGPVLTTFHYRLYPVWLCMWQIIKNLEPLGVNTCGDIYDNQGLCSFQTLRTNLSTSIRIFCLSSITFLLSKRMAFRGHLLFPLILCGTGLHPLLVGHLFP